MLLVSLLAALALPVFCEEVPESVQDLYRPVSDAVVPYLLVGGLTLAMDGEDGKREAWDAAKALAVTGAVTQVLKLTIREKRPNGPDMDSFPSGHTSVAFAMATCLADYKPETAWWAYGMAAAIGYSRVRINAHDWDDVAAGALIGYFVAKQFTDGRDRDVAVTPTGIALRF